MNDTAIIDVDEHSISNMWGRSTSNENTEGNGTQSDVDISEDRELIENYLEDIITFRRQKNFQKLVQSMICLNDQCIDTIQRHPDVYINFSDVESIIKETISSLNEDLQQFLTFAYELRKQDYDNSHTTLLLTNSIMPQILIDMVMSNVWDPSTGTMRCDQNRKFKILMGENNPIVYHKTPAKNVLERPQIKKAGVDRRKYMEDLHLLITPDGNVHIYTSNMNCLLSNKLQLQQGSDNEGEDEALAWLSAQDINGAPGTTNSGDLSHLKQFDSWQLVFANQDNNAPLFFLQTNAGGDKQQKLTANQENPKNGSDLSISSKNQDLSRDMQRMVWKIVSNENC